MSERQENPAETLHLLCLRIVKETPQPSRPETLLEAWMRVLGVEPGRPTHIYGRMSAMLRLHAECKARIERIAIPNHRTFFSALDAVLPVLQPENFPLHVSQFTASALSDHSLNGLQFCVDLLRSQPNRNAIDLKDVAGLEAQVLNLLKAVREDASLDDGMKRLLSEHLSAILAAIADYRIVGITALEAAMERSVGMLMLHQDQIRLSAKSPSLQSFWEIVQKLDSLVNLANALHQLSAWVQPLANLLMAAS